MHNILVMDIETTVNKSLNSLYKEFVINHKMDKRLKDISKIKQKALDIEKTFALNPRTGKITLIGYLSNIKLTNDFKEIDEGYIYCKVNENEDEMLKDFWEILNISKLKGCKLITKNGKKFDMPFIMKRSLIKNIDIQSDPHYELYVSKYNTREHLDIQDILEDGKLIEWAYLLGVSNNLLLDGASCIEWFENDRFDMIEMKNKEDLIQTQYIYRKLERFL